MALVSPSSPIARRPAPRLVWRPSVAALLTGLLLAGLLLAAVLPARAQQAPEADPGVGRRVEELALQAKLLRDEGRLAEAIERLKEAIRLQPTPWLLYNLGRTYEDTGELALARSHYELCLGQGAER
ncbi:MAG: tetratricopeptide repeat protein, partial [Deltaproteobacteria bacterium]|nr:tetratricopeptide repeat protein [Deltaproteobacteria bacterium]